MSRYKITVKGKVQNTGFRISSLEKARQLFLAGFVRNMPDGSVFIDVEGPADALDQFMKWCRKGPSGANVMQLICEPSDQEVGYKAFEIL